MSPPRAAPFKRRVGAYHGCAERPDRCDEGGRSAGRGRRKPARGLARVHEEALETAGRVDVEQARPWGLRSKGVGHPAGPDHDVTGGGFPRRVTDPPHRTGSKSS